MSKVNRNLYNNIFWKDKGFFSWKGKTFNQVTSMIQKNKGVLPTNIKTLFHPMPLKIYRREIASQTMTSCNPRTSLTLDELNRPNGYLIYNTPNTKGLNGTLDISLTTNKYELNTPSCNTKTNCLSQTNNALRRVRSAGMNRKKYNSCTNSDAYNANTEQYLKSRNMSFHKNQFVYKNQVQPSYFKPNNREFKQQGGVESSSFINKVKYNALNKFGASLKTQLGFYSSNKLSYAVPKEDYINKIKPFPLLNRKLLKECISKKCIPK